MLGLAGFSSFEIGAVLGVLSMAVVALSYALWLRRQVFAIPLPRGRMIEVWQGIKEGAEAYLASQWRIIQIMLLVLIVFLFLSSWVILPTPEALEIFGQKTRLVMAVGRAAAFLVGAIFSALVGRWGMRMAISASVRVAKLASEKNSADALRIAYRAGTVTGMLTDGLGLLGGTLIFIIFGKAAPDVLLGFGFGSTLLALLMRVGGGIYTKAADVGADLVGKVEKGIPEDDPRNPAVIADLVGDNVGDCAGMAADIFQSYEVTMVSALILGLALWHQTGQTQWIVYPLLVRGIGVFGSIVGTLSVRARRGENPLKAINRSFYTSAVLSIALFALVAFLYLHEWRAFVSVVVGVGLTILTNWLTAYFTDARYRPVRHLASQTKNGAATTILSGLALGLNSSVWAMIVVAVTIAAAAGIYSGFSATFVLYGVSLIGIGMLTLTGDNLAMDSYGPIVDNAGGIGEMSKINKEGERILAKLDATGNTTKAITKGIAIGSAVIAAVSLFGSYITDVERVSSGVLSSGIRVSEPVVFVGLLLGGSLSFLFSGWLIESVSKAAAAIIKEVRRQFRIPGILNGKRQPNYARAVEICTVSAQKELLPIAVLSVVAPIAVGFLLGVEALGAFLAGLILTGQLMAVFMANAGGAWDNAKKYIEEGNLGGKGSEAHKAGVVGDTVGDPLKDTAGPALNPLVKVINLVSVIIAPIVVVPMAQVYRLLIALILGGVSFYLILKNSV